MQARKLIVISGEQQACLSRAKKLISCLPSDQVIDENVDIKHVLGKEYAAIVYNCYNGFDPDLLGAMGGTIMADGVLILVTPPLDKWHTYSDPFNDRIANWPYSAGDMSGYFIRRFVDRIFVYQSKEPDFITFLTADSSPVPSVLSPSRIRVRQTGFKTQDQATALGKMRDMLCNEADHVAPAMVLEADRGRGKSALLGMLAESLQEDTKILVTAPSRKTAEVIFRHAKGTVTNHVNPVFIAPDQLCHEYPRADLLLVDEAAAIPSVLLTRMLQHYPRVVFATTVHGYEGTGRGFALRFKQQLDSLRPGWQNLILRQPIRYAENDPLETFLFDSLLLDAKPVSTKLLMDFSLQACHYEKIKAEQLYRNESLLREVFGLLVLAHYQTRPTDLRHLLDGINVSLSVIKWRGHVVATALSVMEGGFDEPLAHDIHYGIRRPRGHLVPQSLAVHAGIAEAPLYRTERIMRIVVHPAVQREGVASLLLKHIKQQAQEKTDIDYLSSSFGATPDLLEFWKQQQFQPVRIGLSRDASSGCHSIVVMHALSVDGKALLKKAHYQFQRYFPVLLTEPLKDLEDPLIQAMRFDDEVQKKWQTEAVTLNKQDHLDIQSFAYGKRGYESCMLALQKLVKHMINEEVMWKVLAPDQQKLVMQKIIEQQSWQTVVMETALSGRKQALKELRMIIQEIVEIM